VLAAALAVTIAGIDQQAAERLVQGADAICPYSNAIRGNVDVAVSVSTREPDRSIHPNPVLEHAARRSTVLARVRS